jgi:FMN phosphatase YigB (HAD superfamily)
METKKILLCFDLDDTLIDDNFKFEITFCDCIKTILLAFETRAPQIDDVLQQARELDNEKMSTWPSMKKYMPDRLLSTWLETYQTLCAKHNIEVKEHVNLILEGLVKQNFEPPYYIIPGAIETLTSLFEDDRYEMQIITAGNSTIQNKKLSTTSLSKFFSNINVVPDGDKYSVLEKLSQGYDKKDIYMIGNSLSSDINQALKAGVNAIHIPRGSWHQFKAEPLHNNFKTLSDISELVTYLDKVRSE